MKMKNNATDDFELPEDVEPAVAVEPVVEVPTQNSTLPAPQIKTHKPTWLSQHGPRPPSAGVRALDGIVVILFGTALVLFVKAWIWAVFS